MATQFNVPTREEVSENNKVIFDQLEKGVGFVPNLYASLAHSESALGDYLTLQNRRTSLKAKEKELINLVVSQVNECPYCLAAHTAIGKMNGFSEDQILEIRTGRATFDSKLDALAQFVRNITINRSKPSAEAVENLYAAGYIKENLIDIIIMIGDKTITNFLYGATQIPVDFPAAPELVEA
ncbi:carboxymuconolactone decarboxylase family protein [Fulvivirga lutimaris]|uniref:carboxymuconolactone decarboxylase family protein n=1 Tax=Fulvivirga lutimaris TaxID=1819566 RepID=UPI0012BC3AD1|nr:carboxymuconolactone decarboxylase family protein [Fulvivirga lutimaris]MTI39424.1 carboxymuconolactone decarboxylase family protein [Fulvivirga lutimaris]